MTADQLEKAALAALDAMEAKFGAPSWRFLAGIPGALEKVRLIEPASATPRPLTDIEKDYIRMRCAE